METTADDRFEARAKRLQHTLEERGIDCVLHWDRSPWGVRIWLTHEDGPECETPSLFVLTDEISPYRPGCYVWRGCFGGFSEETDEVLNDVHLEFSEWGDDDDTRINGVAEAVKAFLRLLVIQEVRESA